MWYEYANNNSLWGYNHHQSNGCDNNGDYQGDYEAGYHSQQWNGTGGNGDDQNNVGCCTGVNGSNQTEQDNQTWSAS